MALANLDAEVTRVSAAFLRSCEEARLVRQCAWCRRVVDRTGHYSGPPQPQMRHATHGICPPCRGEFVAKIG